MCWCELLTQENRSLEEANRSQYLAMIFAANLSWQESCELSLYNTAPNIDPVFTQAQMVNWIEYILFLLKDFFCSDSEIYQYFAVCLGVSTRLTLDSPGVKIAHETRRTRQKYEQENCYKV